MMLTWHYARVGRLEVAWHDPDAGWGLSVMWLSANRLRAHNLVEWGFRRVTP